MRLVAHVGLQPHPVQPRPSLPCHLAGCISADLEVFLVASPCLPLTGNSAPALGFPLCGEVDLPAFLSSLLRLLWDMGSPWLCLLAF